jgi:hypothetical protein
METQMTTRIFRIVPMDSSGNVCSNTIFTEDASRAAAAVFDGDDVSIAEVDFERCEVAFCKITGHTEQGCHNDR